MTFRLVRGSLIVRCSLAVVGAGARRARLWLTPPQHGNKDAVKALLKQAADVNAAQGDGMTALHWAAMNGDAEMVDMLVYAGANIRATTRIGAYTPLYLASQRGHAAAITSLLKAGGDVKAGTPTAPRR